MDDLVIQRGHENDRQLGARFLQSALQVKARHAAQVNIQDKARHFIPGVVLEECFGRCKNPGGKTASLQQPLHGLQHRELVVDDGDELAPIRHEAILKLSPVRQSIGRESFFFPGKGSYQRPIATIVLWCNTGTHRFHHSTFCLTGRIFPFRLRQIRAPAPCSKGRSRRRARASKSTTPKATAPQTLACAGPESRSPEGCRQQVPPDGASSPSRSAMETASASE